MNKASILTNKPELDIYVSNRRVFCTEANRKGMPCSKVFSCATAVVGSCNQRVSVGRC